MKKLDYIDAMRGLAILGVMLLHCSTIVPGRYPFFVKNIFESGSRGVQLFFLVSAFTLFLSFRNNPKITKQSTLKFFLRRFFRIAPMYYLGILYYTLNYHSSNLLSKHEVSITETVLNIFFIHGTTPYWINGTVPGGWSISIEMMFYCLVPFLVSKIKSLNDALALFILTVLLKTVLFIIFHHYPLIPDRSLWDLFLFFYLPNQLPVFACGIIMFFIITVPKNEWKIKPEYLFYLAILILVQIATGTTLLFELNMQFAIAFIILGYSLSKKQFFIVVNPITRYIGKISFSMYLVHFAILNWLVESKILDVFSIRINHVEILNVAIRFLILLVLSVIVSTFFYHVIENPFQKIGRKIIANKNFFREKSSIL